MSTPGVFDAEQFKEQVRQNWARQAAQWRKWTSQKEVQSRAATQLIVQAARIKPGMRVLDLASGTGDPALTVAEAVGPHGHVTATDLASEMLAVAEERSHERRLANMTFRQADAEVLPFPDQAFNAVTCRWGVMFFPDVQQALQEIQRVLKPGGCAAFVAWGPSEQELDAWIPQNILKKYVTVPPPQPGAPSAGRFAQPGTLSAALREAGFRQVQEASPTIPYPWPGPPEQNWEAQKEYRRSTQRLVERLAPEQRAQVDAEVVEAIRKYYDGQQVNFTACVVVASGVR